MLILFIPLSYFILLNCHICVRVHHDAECPLRPVLLAESLITLLERSLSQFAMAAHIYGHAATLFDPLHLAVPERRLQVWTVQLNCELRDAMRPAEGARLEGLVDLVVAFPAGA